MVLKYNQFLLENSKFYSKFYSQIYYSLHNNPDGSINMSDEKVKIKAQEIYNKFNTDSFKKWFNGSIVRNEHSFTTLGGGDKSPMIVYHSSNQNFNKFNTPAFFGAGSPNAYEGDYYYYCVLQMKKPLELRRTELGYDKWLELISKVLKDIPRFDEMMDFAEKYEDGYGFFKLLQGNMFEYRWDLVYDYINKNGYDGAIYRESDQSISWYFDGYLVMKPDQIKIVHKQKINE